MDEAVRLLRDAISDQITLRKDLFWARQIPKKTYPILWFGDERRKNLVVTMGANPSILEFYKSVSKKYEFRESGSERFHLLKGVCGANLLDDGVTLSHIIEGYRSYFKHRPYAGWFGAPNGGRIEAFINGLGASFYDSNPGLLRAVSIDLMPFVTFSKYKSLDDEGKITRDIFNSGIAKKHFEGLINYLKPDWLLVYGRSNIEHFKIIIKGLPKMIYKDEVNLKLDLLDVDGMSVKLVRVDTSLGNPMVTRSGGRVGLTRDELFFIASRIRGDAACI